MEEKEDLRSLISALKNYTSLNCEVFKFGCFDCNEIDCPNYSNLCLLVGKLGGFFLKYDSREAEKLLVTLLTCGNKGVGCFAFCDLERARIRGKFLTLATLIEMQKFRRNPANSQAIFCTDIMLKIEKAPWN